LYQYCKLLLPYNALGFYAGSKQETYFQEKQHARGTVAPQKKGNNLKLLIQKLSRKEKINLTLPSILPSHDHVCPSCH